MDGDFVYPWVMGTGAVVALMKEHRTSRRLRTLKGGLILYGTAPAFDCVIRNMSTTGALLVVNPVDIPEEFTLVIKPEMLKRACKVAWRSVDKMGIRFV